MNCQQCFLPVLFFTYLTLAFQVTLGMFAKSAAMDLTFTSFTEEKALSSFETSATKPTCHNQKVRCGEKCEFSKDTFLYNRTVDVPYLCEKVFDEERKCPDSKSCGNQKPRKAICSRSVIRRGPCPNAGTCANRMMLNRHCENGKNCAGLLQHGCLPGEQLLFEPEPTDCERCTQRKWLKTCRKKVAQKGSVPCAVRNYSHTLPTLPVTGMGNSEAEVEPLRKVLTERGLKVLLPFGDDSPSVKNLRCFASFFDETECDGVDEICRITTRGFDSVKCTLSICSQCRHIEKFRASRALIRYCRYLTQETCQKVNIVQIGKSRSDLRMPESARYADECREMISAIIHVPCHEDIGTLHACVNGCRRRVLGCAKNLKICAPHQSVCEFRETEKFLCNDKSDSLDHGDQLVPCGKKKEIALGRYRALMNCRPKYCVKQVCDDSMQP